MRIELHREMNVQIRCRIDHESRNLGLQWKNRRRTELQRAHRMVHAELQSLVDVLPCGDTLNTVQFSILWLTQTLPNLPFPTS